MKKTAILFMIPLLRGYGGTEKHILSILGNINRELFIPYLCYFQGDSYKNSIITDFKKKNINPIKFSMNNIYGTNAIKNIFKIKNFIRNKRIQILQTFHPNADLYGPVVGKISFLPILISSRRDLGLNRPQIALQKKINCFVNNIIVPSQAVKKATMEQENVPGSKINIIYNGVDTNYFQPEGGKSLFRRKLGLKESDLIITMTSNLKKIKGIDYFIKAAFLISQEIANAKFVIIGGGKEKDFLLNLTAHLGITDKIIFTGNISNVKDYLSASDLYVSSSLTEGFSNSILEAMAMGLPIVATDVGGNKEAVMNGENGFLVPPQDYYAIASYIIQLCRDFDLRIMMGEKSRDIVKKSFTMERMVKEYEQFYTALLHEKS